MAHAKDFGPRNDNDADDGAKAGMAREVMGLASGKEATHVPKFHSMHIAAASNGAIVEHTKKSNPTGPDKVKKVVIPHDHPMHKHVQALHDHCEDCPDQQVNKF